jgi:hypothetical protein
VGAGGTGEWCVGVVVFAVVGAVASLAFELMFAGGVFLNHEWTRIESGWGVS